MKVSCNIKNITKITVLTFACFSIQCFAKATQQQKKDIEKKYHSNSRYFKGEESSRKWLGIFAAGFEGGFDYFVPSYKLQTEISNGRYGAGFSLGTRKIFGQKGNGFNDMLAHGSFEYNEFISESLLPYSELDGIGGKVMYQNNLGWLVHKGEKICMGMYLIGGLGTYFSGINIANLEIISNNDDIELSSTSVYGKLGLGFNWIIGNSPYLTSNKDGKRPCNTEIYLELASGANFQTTTVHQISTDFSDGNFIARFDFVGALGVKVGF